MCFAHPSLYPPQKRERGLHLRVMLCWRGLGTTNIHRLFTTYISDAKKHHFSLTTKNSIAFFSCRLGGGAKRTMTGCYKMKENIFDCKWLKYKDYVYICIKYMIYGNLYD